MFISKTEYNDLVDEIADLKYWTNAYRDQITKLETIQRLVLDHLNLQFTIEPKQPRLVERCKIVASTPIIGPTLSPEMIAEIQKLNNFK